MYPIIAENIVYPLGDLIFQTSVIKYFHWLQKTQWWSPEQLKDLQDRKLRTLITHAYNKAPYYKKLFSNLGLMPSDIQTTEDLSKLPVLTKEDIRTHFDELKAADFDSHKPIPNATGGSTGEPLRYYISKDVSSINWASMYRGWSWAGYGFGDKRATLAGSSLIPGQSPSMFTRMRSAVERNLPLSAVHLNKEILSSYATRLASYKPDFLRGYPSAIYTMADYLKHTNIDTIKPKAIFTTAEMLLPNHREAIESQFGCKVFDQYGAYDGGGQAMECELHQGFHITVEKAIMEILDVKGNTSPPGESGRIVVTDLHNYAMPFIRYEVGDIGIMSNQPCACGRSLPLLKSIEGRTTDIIKFSNGVTIAGPAVTLMFKDREVKQYQLVQEAHNELTVSIVKNNNYTDVDTNKLLGVLKHHTGSGIHIHINFCDHIPNEPNGKYKFIIQKQG
ncbi:putative capsular polysaccharide biosynthesis protein [Dehalogenimonas sp. WBC-2]|nr:putative capsular polysaccharide biosynthesis protein [Dehalogenimonas sp. WBC-2]